MPRVHLSDEYTVSLDDDKWDYRWATIPGRYANPPSLFLENHFTYSSQRNHIRSSGAPDFIQQTFQGTSFTSASEATSVDLGDFFSSVTWAYSAPLSNALSQFFFQIEHSTQLDGITFDSFTTQLYWSDIRQPIILTYFNCPIKIKDLKIFSSSNFTNSNIPSDNNKQQRCTALLNARRIRIDGTGTEGIIEDIAFDNESEAITNLNPPVTSFATTDDVSLLISRKTLYVHEPIQKSELDAFTSPVDNHEGLYNYIDNIVGDEDYSTNLKIYGIITKIDMSATGSMSMNTTWNEAGNPNNLTVLRHRSSKQIFSETSHYIYDNSKVDRLYSNTTSPMVNYAP